MRRRAVALAALVVVAAAAAITGTARAADPSPPPALTEKSATALFLAVPKVADWIGRYPAKSLVTRATYEEKTRAWTVMAWSGPAGEIAMGKVEDLTERVTEAYTGPQVAWPMARGRPGAFGGKDLNRLPVWLGLCAVFLLGLADLRRPLSLRNLDLLALVGFTVSLWYFNHGRVFSSASWAYPPLVYLLVRMTWIGIRGRAPRTTPPVWPVWFLAAATIFVVGFRIGLVATDSNVIDVGYAGVIGAERIDSGQVPYGRFPKEEGKPCAAPDASGRQVYRYGPDGRCESANPHGDTYGPVNYQAYLPGFWLFGWKGMGDRLNAARFTSTLFDVLCIVGLALVGRRLGGARLAVTLAFAWAAFPFTQYAVNAGSNDMIPPLFLILGFLAAGSARGRGAAIALAGWTKFAPLIVAPLWATYPERRVRPVVAFLAGFVVASAAALWILLLDGHPIGAVRLMWERTVSSQFARNSPFSLWDWRQYHAGLPDLHLVQRVLQALLVAGALAAAFLPRRKTPLQLAALTAALLIGFQIVLTHWFYLYIAWFFPFVAIAVCAASPARATVEDTAPETRDGRSGELAPAR